MAEKQTNKTVQEILAGDVYDEEFLIAFHSMLNKFVKEYDDMAQMTAIRQAGELLKTFNE